MDTRTVVNAIRNLLNTLPPAARQELLVEALASGAPKRGPGRTPRARNGTTDSGRKRGRRKGGPGKASEEQVLAYVKSNPDQRTEQISAGVGANAKWALSRMRASGMVKTKGKRRATTYRVAGIKSPA